MLNQAADVKFLGCYGEKNFKLSSTDREREVVCVCGFFFLRSDYVLIALVYSRNQMQSRVQGICCN